MTPRISVKRLSLDRGGSAANAPPHGTRSSRPDKSEDDNPGARFQDQSASLTTLETTTDGLHIEVEANGVYSSAEYPDGFKFTQTINTNVPLGGATSPYVDPRPNDDAKPFYWTDAEQARHLTTFIDYPKRPAPGSGTTRWEAILALNGVNENTRTVTAHDALTYGFTRDSAGTISILGPASVGTSGHQATLASEFSGWTFG